MLERLPLLAGLDYNSASDSSLLGGVGSFACLLVAGEDFEITLSSWSSMMDSCMAEFTS